MGPSWRPLLLARRERGIAWKNNRDDVGVAIIKKATLADGGILSFFWLIFYMPIWTGVRHVGYDMDGYNYPLDRYILSALQNAAKLPTWDWFSYNGIDFAGNVQSAAFYPPKLLLEIVFAIAHLPLNYPIYQFFVLLHVLAFSLGAYVVGRWAGVPRFWTVTGAIFLCYTGVLQAQIQHFWFITALPWLPFIVYGAYDGAMRRNARGIYVYVLASVGLSLIGYPLQYLTIQVEVFVFILIARLVPLRPFSLRNVLEPVLGFIGCQLVVMLVSAASVLPFLSLVPSSIAEVGGGSIPLRDALTIVLPDVFGHLSGSYKGPEDPTVSFFFVGLVLELAFLAVPLARGAIAKSPRGFALAGGFLVVNAALEFLPLHDMILHAIPVLADIRPQTAGMPFALAFAALVVLVLVAADRAATPRLRTALRIGGVIAALSLFINRPGFFSTPTGPATDVDAASQGFVSGGIPDDRYILAIDQSTLGGSADNWPRVLGVRTLGGEDPLAQRPYLELLDAKGLHESGRRVYFSDNADFKWLEANGVGLVLTTNPKIFALAKKENWRMVEQVSSGPMYALPDPVPLAGSSCARNVSAILSVDAMTVHYDSAEPACTIRLTTNYSASFVADGGATLAPIQGALGMTLAHLPSASSDIHISYANSLAVLGRWLSLAGLVVLLVPLAVRRRVFGSRAA